MRKISFLIFITAIVLFGGLPDARASEIISRFPPEFRQTWAKPSCQNAERVFLLTKRFVFEGSHYSNLLYRQKHMRRHGGIYRLQSGSTAQTGPSGLNYAPVYDIKLVSGRLMRFELPLFVSNAAIDPCGDGYADPYVLCPAPLSEYDNLSLEGLYAIRALDRIDEICGTVPVAKSPACQHTIFEAFDRDGDGALSAGELARAYRQISFISPSQGCQMELYYPANIAVEGPLFAKAALDAADSDKDGSLTFEEIQTGWPRITEKDSYHALKPLIDNLSTLLPFLPAGPLLPGCSCLAQES